MEDNIMPIEYSSDIKFKGKKGIYFLFDKNKELVYIGKTKLFRRRIYQHLYSINKKFPDNFIKYFCFIELSDMNWLYVNQLEAGFIEYYLPIFNNVPYRNTQEIIKYIEKKQVKSKHIFIWDEGTNF